MSAGRPLIAQLLLDRGLAPEARLDAALRDRRGRCFEQVLTEAGIATGEQLAELYSAHLGVPLVRPSSSGCPEAARHATALPEKFLRENAILPLEAQGPALLTAFADPSDLALQGELQIYTGKPIVPAAAPIEEIRQTLDGIFGRRDLIQETAAEQALETAQPEPGAEETLDLDALVGSAEETRIVRLVNNILREAVDVGASDVHLEPSDEGLIVRLRVDGLLRELSRVPRAMAPALVSRLKILSRLDIAEKRVPLDGAFSVSAGGCVLDLRVSTIPTIWGEKVVLRLLNRGSSPAELDTLGFDERQREAFVSAARSSNGLLFVTGPTGSGKSTTLYATLSMLRSPARNLVSVEDPVEFKIAGVNQVSVRAGIGLTFAKVLRSFMRQDPDIIMVGEVRDAETAEVSMRAALTGHMVLSTMHTNDAIASIARLRDLGVPPFLIASTLRGLAAQRLVRRLCPDCKEAYEPDIRLRERYGLPAGRALYRPAGCDSCQHSGYRGRMALFEVYRITAQLADLIRAEAPARELVAAARSQGTLSLFEHGVLEATRGSTSLEEVLRATVGE